MAATMRTTTRKLPKPYGVFSYARIPQADSAGAASGVVYRLFRRDMHRVLHCEQRVFSSACDRRYIAFELNLSRHRLRNTVDEIDLEIMGVTNA